MAQLKKILLVDDDDDLRDALSEQLLLTEDFDVFEAGNGADAKTRAAEALYDLVILDVGLPDIDGRDLCRDLRTQGVKSPILMLTGHDSDADTIMGLDAGANDYVTKPFSPKELIARIKAVMRRVTPTSNEEPIEFNGLKLEPVSHRVMANEDPLDMGPTEFKLLHFFMTHPERVYSRELLLDNVWGTNVYVEDRTVDVHIRRLRKAISRHGHDAMIQTVRGAGYRFSTKL